MSNPNHTDRELLLAYRSSGDGQALAELYKRYAHLVLGLCLDYLKDREAARDATMDIFEKVAIKLKQTEVEYFKSWLFAVSKNHCLDCLRKQSKAAPLEFSEEIFVESEAEARLDENQRLEALREGLHQLKAHQRSCVVAFYLQGQTYEQVAEKTGFSLKEVKSYLQNGRRNLRIYLEKRANESV
ncbi:MAG: sigma-70 family RNA polymerase sigma factor [Bacteroidota bacterium]